MKLRIFNFILILFFQGMFLFAGAQTIDLNSKFETGDILIDKNITNISSIMLKGDIVPTLDLSHIKSLKYPFTVTCIIDGAKYESKVNVLESDKDKESIIRFDKWHALPGKYDIRYKISTDTKTLVRPVSIIKKAPAKKVFCEEGTGTWCGYCVEGIVIMDSLERKYGDSFIGISIHISDVMADSVYDNAYCKYICNGGPTGALDRVDLGGSDDCLMVKYFEEKFIERVKEIPSADVSVENIDYNTSSRKLKFELKADFVVDVSDYNFNAIIVEDNVTGTGSEYDQYNYYRDNVYGKMGGFEDLPNPVPAEDMVYRNVARRIIGGWEGKAESLPLHIKAGESHSYGFETEILDTWNPANIKIIGILINNVTGEVENASVSANLLSTSASDDTANVRDVVIYPNPARNRIYISGTSKGKLSLYDIKGSLIVSMMIDESKTSIDVSNLDSGVYIARIDCDNASIIKKVDIMK